MELLQFYYSHEERESPNVIVRESAQKKPRRVFSAICTAKICSQVDFSNEQQNRAILSLVGLVLIRSPC
jgi:hypothetical protein